MSQRKKPRVFSRDYKMHAVERMLAGESGSALARELQVRRKLLYEWKDAYLVGGAKALRSRGRPRRGERLGLPPQVGPGRGELLRARQRIAELERIVGRQQLEHDFFAEALRRVQAVEEAACNELRSTRSSRSRRCKAD
ncbi:MAG: transposase [Acidobacteriia bacterium]|nr:transposase [Terriglobia bacterium]